MQPDGHCMYRAVQDQLSLRSDDQQQQTSAATVSDNDHQTDAVMDLRKKTADYMRSHRNDFLPFLMQVRTFAQLLATSFGRNSQYTSGKITLHGNF